MITVITHLIIVWKIMLVLKWKFICIFKHVIIYYMILSCKWLWSVLFNGVINCIYIIGGFEQHNELDIKLL